MPSDKQNITFLAVLFLLVGLSVFATYYRYIIKNDFVYFTTEESIPDRFAQSSYPQL